MNNFYNNKFWNNYYKKNYRKKNSSFSKFCFNNFIKFNNYKKKNLIDIGCGNGADSYFFYKKNLNIYALDESKVAIRNNLILYKNKINFILASIFSKFKFKIKFSYIYLRFFLHTIRPNEEKRLFKIIKRLGEKGSLIFFEFRTDKDPLMKKGNLSKYNITFTDHYRRFINLKKLIFLLKKDKKIKILYVIEKKGLSRYRSDNPVLARLILRLN